MSEKTTAAAEEAVQVALEALMAWRVQAAPQRLCGSAERRLYTATTALALALDQLPDKQQTNSKQTPMRSKTGKDHG